MYISNKQGLVNHVGVVIVSLASEVSQTTLPEPCYFQEDSNPGASLCNCKFHFWNVNLYSTVVTWWQHVTIFDGIYLASVYMEVQFSSLFLGGGNCTSCITRRSPCQCFCSGCEGGDYHTVFWSATGAHPEGMYIIHREHFWQSCGVEDNAPWNM